jgi:hypothetical protein
LNSEWSDWAISDRVIEYEAAAYERPPFLWSHARTAEQHSRRPTIAAFSRGPLKIALILTSGRTCGFAGTAIS